MVGWIILGILGFIVLLFVLLLTVHAHVIIDYKDEFALTVKVLGIPIHILPKKKKTYRLKDYTLKKIRRREKIAAKKKAKADRKAAQKALEKAQKKAADKKLTKAQRKAAKARKKAERPAVTDMVPLVGRVAQLFFSHFFGKLHIRMARIHVVVGGKNTAETAITYGVMTHAMGALVSLLQKICDVDSLKKADIDVHPDFTAESTTVDCHVTFRMSLGNVLWAAIKAGWHFLLGYIKVKPDVPDEAHKKGHKGKKAAANHNPEADTPPQPTHVGGVPLPHKPSAPAKPSAPPKPW